MATEKFTVSIVLKAFDKASPVASGLKSSLARLGTSVSGLGKKFTSLNQRIAKSAQKMKDVGKKMSTRLSLPIAAFGALAVKTAVSFETSMNKVAAVTNATGEQFKNLEALAMKMGATTQFSASQAADAMTFLGMAGLSTDEIMKALPGTLELAAAGGLDLATAADIATNVMAAMGKEVSELGHVNDVLAFAASNANTNIMELAEAMKPVAGTASALGVSLEETTALLGKMADTGNKGSIAGTLLRNAMLAVATASSGAKETFKDLGIDISKFIAKGGKIKNFTVLIDELTEKGATVEQIFSIFGQRGARAVLDLQKTGGKAIRGFTKDLEGSEGTAKRMQDTMMRGLPGAFKLLSSAFEGVQLAIVKSGLGDFLNNVVRGIAALLGRLAKANPTLLKVITIIAGIVAVLGPLVFVLGLAAPAFAAFGAGFTLLLGPIGLVILAVTALAAAAYLIIDNWEVVKKFFSDFWNSVVEMFDNSIQWIKDKFFGLIDSILNIGSKISGFFSGLFGDEEKKIKISPELKKLGTPAIRGVIAGQKDMTQTDINIRIKSSEDTEAIVSDVRKKRGKANVRTTSESFMGLTNLVPVR